MTNRYSRLSTAITELTANHFSHHDEEVMQALVTAGALVALSE